MSKKILIIGHGGHGKDTVAGILYQLFGYRFESSSVVALRIFLYDKLRDKYNYTSPEECFKDRNNHRKEWYDLIREYNRYDKARLAKDVMLENDVYVGMRDYDECEESIRQKIFDLIIGVWDYRKPCEEGSFTINMWKKSHFILVNDTTIDDLRSKILRLRNLFNK